jgi:hypothetical protein
MRNRRVNSKGNAFRSCCTNEEAIEHAKGDRWHGEEVHGRNRFPVVSQEASQRLAGSGSLDARFIQRDGSFAEFQTEHQQLAVDARRSSGLDSQQPSGRSTLSNVLRRRLPLNRRPGSKRSASSTSKNQPDASELRFPDAIRNGNCRLMGSSAAQLSETAARWRRAVTGWAHATKAKSSEGR